MANTILISWLGETDIKSWRLEEHGSRGPFFTIIDDYYRSENPFDSVYLLYTCDNERYESSAKEIKFYLSKNYSCTLVPINISDPTDIQIVYQKMLSFLESKEQILAHSDIYFNITSGTSAMHTVSLLLCRQHLVGKRNVALKTIAQRFVKEDGRQVFPVVLPDSLANIFPVSGKNVYSKKPFIPTINKKIFEQTRYKVAPTNASVLILGDTGVGKSFLAEYIHNYSERKNKPFLSLNCALFAGDANMLRSELFGHTKGAFTGADKEAKGAFVNADGGTLFLDEIGEIPYHLQGLLLHALDDGTIIPVGSATTKKVNVRIIAATNKNLLQCVKDGTFRQDLYYRLAQYTPCLHPVSSYSKDDKIKLLDLLLEKVNVEMFGTQQKRLSSEARDCLLAWDWPGNIREMKFRLTSIAILSDDYIELHDVQSQIHVSAKQIVSSEDTSDFIPQDIKAWIEESEKDFIRKALDKEKGNKAGAARLLGLPTPTLESKIKKYGLK